MSLPLNEFRVLDFTRHLPGPYATDLLRRLGAEVYKVEPPDGDPTRWIPPFEGDDGALFHLLNRGKSSVVVDLKSDEGRTFAQRLAAHCDVVVESYRPGTTREFGIDPDSLLAINPKLIYCSVTGFGSGSPRSAHDLNFVALAGLLDLQRDDAGRPVLPSTQIGDMGGALFAALSIVAALLERQSTGRGRVIDISMAETTRALMPTAEALYRGTHHTPETFLLTGAIPNYAIYPTADGRYVSVASLEPRFWARFCEAIGHPELIERQFDGPAAEMAETIARTIASRTRDEWEERFREIDACVEPVLSIEEAHERFGDPLQAHPLQRNFPAPASHSPRLGSGFESAARLAGLAESEAKQLRHSETFRPKGRLRKLLLRAHHAILNR